MRNRTLCLCLIISVTGCMNVATTGRRRYNRQNEKDFNDQYALTCYQALYYKAAIQRCQYSIAAKDGDVL